MVDRFMDEPATTKMTSLEFLERPCLRVVVVAAAQHLADLVDRLRVEGHIVRRTSRVWNAVELMTTWAPDAIVVYVEHDYAATASLLRPLPPMSSKVIAVVGRRATSGVVTDARSSGLAAVFREPCDPADVCGTIERIQT